MKYVQECERIIGVKTERTLSYNEVNARLHSLANPKDAELLQRYFKTGPGQYAEGDKFLGIKVPKLRQLANKCHDISLASTERLLHSPYNEARLLALFVMIHKYNKGDKKDQSFIYHLYLKNLKNINNWNLIDLSAPRIVGVHLINRSRKPLFALAKSKNLWRKRIAILSTFYFISNRDFDDALKITEMLLQDKHDLIHKACGWALREIGKRDVKVLEKFIQNHYKEMPRTTLRYSIERFSPRKRKAYLHGEF
ncbi:MAG: DNA alkylation repair protein [Bdellovibrio sp.]